MSEILKEFGAEAYGYAEDTGDYSMKVAEEQPFFREAMNAILQKWQQYEAEKCRIADVARGAEEYDRMLLDVIRRLRL